MHKNVLYTKDAVMFVNNLEKLTNKNIIFKTIIFVKSFIYLLFD